jgi:hypothetical protein
MTLVLSGCAEFIDKYDRMKIRYDDEETKKILVSLSSKDRPITMTRDGYFISCKKINNPKSLLGCSVELTCHLYDWETNNRCGRSIIATNVRVKSLPN